MKNPGFKSVAVVVPCYNYGKYVGEAIESLASQTVKPDEIIIVDDGSTERETIDSIQEVTAQYPGVCSYRIENSGVSFARNYGIRQTTSELICCLDADDKLAPSYIEECLKIFNIPGRKLGFVTTWVEMFGTHSDHWNPEKSDINDFFVQNCAHVASMFSREAWQAAGGYIEPRHLLGYEDWRLWLGMLCSGYEYEVIREPLFLYRRHPGSMITSSDARREFLYTSIIEEHVSRVRENALEIIRKFQMCLAAQIRRNDSTIEDFKQAYLSAEKLLQEKQEYIIKLEKLVTEVKATREHAEKLAEEYKTAFLATERLVDDRDQYIKVLETRSNG